MVTSADMLAWTGLTVSTEDIAIYEPVCNELLQADGGDALPETVQVTALCYLIASKIDAKNTSNQFSSEHLGSYSYNRKTSTTLSYWMELYNGILSDYLSKAGISSLVHGNGAIRADKHVLTLNRRYI